MRERDGGEVKNDIEDNSDSKCETKKKRALKYAGKEWYRETDIGKYIHIEQERVKERKKERYVRQSLMWLLPARSAPQLRLIHPIPGATLFRICSWNKKERKRNDFFSWKKHLKRISLHTFHIVVVANAVLVWRMWNIDLNYYSRAKPIIPH